MLEAETKCEQHTSRSSAIRDVHGFWNSGPSSRMTGISVYACFFYFTTPRKIYLQSLILFFEPLQYKMHVLQGEQLR